MMIRSYLRCLYAVRLTESTLDSLHDDYYNANELDPDHGFETSLKYIEHMIKAHHEWLRENSK